MKLISRKTGLFISLITAITFAQTHEATEAEIAAFPQWRENQRAISRVRSLPTAPRAIAEFEPMQAVVVSYQNFNSSEFGFNSSFITTLAEEIRVMILSNRSNISSLERQLQNAGANLDSITILPYKTDSYWTRDYAPWWIADGDQEISIVDFAYNRPRDNDNGVNSYLAGELGNVPVHYMDLVQCGGNYMCDGSGASAATDLVYEENLDKSEAQINTLMENYLGITDYAVLPDPLGDYIKHVDCWGKYLAPNKIVISDVNPSDPRKPEFDEVASYFENKISPYGTPFEVYRVYSDGEPYTNSLILNDRVFVPIQGNYNDEAALEVYRTAMPGYRIIGVKNTSNNPWLSTDALHCRTRGIPDLEMLYINHTPPTDTIVSDSTFTLSSSIIDFSKQGLKPEALNCYYRVQGESEFQTGTLTSEDDSLYTAEIAPHWQGSETIEYYFSAEDSSGRVSHFPFIGEDDLLTFVGTAEQSVGTVSPSTKVFSQSVIPSNEGIVVTTGMQNAQLKLYRLNGQLLSTSKLTQGVQTVSLGSTKGMVLYNLVGNGSTVSGKLLIK